MHFENITPDAVFNICITLGLMLLFSMFVEWLVGTYVLPKIKLGSLPLFLGVILGIGLLIFGITQRANMANSEPNQLEHIETGVGLLIGAAVSVGVVLTFGIGYIRHKIGATAMAIMTAAFFGFAVLAYLVLRQNVPEGLADNDLFFISVSVALFLVGIGAIAMRPLLANQDYRPEQMKINPTVDPMSFGEKRRQRLNKKRSRQL
jgi:FtsH-binding integral membrane protein